MAAPIYMDHHATTPVDERVVQAMIPVFTQTFGNPSSTDHQHGAEANRLVNEAREQVARLIGAKDPDEVLFTSGATESDNMALRGVLRQGDHLITTRVEHKAILQTCRDLERQGVQVTYLDVDDQGLLTATDVQEALRPATKLISIMAANNEMGAIYPLDEIGAMLLGVNEYRAKAKESPILFHTDAAQACGHIPVDVDAMNIDLLSMSAHKMYGPKGIGALYVRRPNRRVKMMPLLSGGGQERNLRSGTHNVPGIVGLGVACRLAREELKEEMIRVAKLRDDLWSKISGVYDSFELIGPALAGPRLPHNLMVSFAPFKARAILRALTPLVSVSTGSACQTDRTEASHVLAAMGLAEQARFALRFGFGRGTTQDVVAATASALEQAIAPLRSLA
jgi:cysteine desulfurase